MIIKSSLLCKNGSLFIFMLALLYGTAYAEICPKVTYNGKTPDVLINGLALGDRDQDWMVLSGGIIQGQPATFMWTEVMIKMNGGRGDFVKCIYEDERGYPFVIERMRFSESPAQLVPGDTRLWTKKSKPNELWCNSSTKDQCGFYEALNTALLKKSFEEALKNYANDLTNIDREKEYDKAIANYSSLLWECIEQQSHCQKDSGLYDLSVVTALSQVINYMQQQGYMNDSEKYVTYRYSQFLYIKYSRMAEIKK